MRLAMEVPVTNRPLALSGKPKIRRIQRTIWRSTSMGTWSRPPRLAFEPRRQHLRQHAYGCAAAMNPAHESGVHVAGGEGQDIAHEFADARRPDRTAPREDRRGSGTRTSSGIGCQTGRSRMFST